MKTIGKITTTLLILLSLYLLSYWLLIKKDWADTLFADPDGPCFSDQAYDAVGRAFLPLSRLDSLLHKDAPVRSYLSGHWYSDAINDFVTFGPNDECRFCLGDFTFHGKVKYDRSIDGFSAEFQHQGQQHTFNLTPGGYDDTVVIDDPFNPNSYPDLAQATILHKTSPDTPPTTDLQARLSGYPPTASPTPLIKLHPLAPIKPRLITAGGSLLLDCWGHPQLWEKTPPHLPASSSSTTPPYQAPPKKAHPQLSGPSQSR